MMTLDSGLLFGATLYMLHRYSIHNTDLRWQTYKRDKSSGPRNKR